ncbi:MAG TPA: hypothetical protein VFV73_31640 [Streptosporangiaceae bacterium]|nr:hypothetical protein [Streptosporangiaceae bacterium]
MAAVAEDLTRAIPGHLPVRTEAPPSWMHDAWEHGGFARDFATANGQRVIVAARTHQQFADLATTTRLVSTFAFLERLLKADFSTCGDLYVHRAAIARLLAPWFARRTVADLTNAFTGTSVPWALLRNLTG